MLPEPLARLAGLVRDLARGELLPRFRAVGATRKADGSLLTEADLRMQSALGEALLREWPGSTLLGEEMGAADQQAALARMTDGVWCVDPLDGTTNFAAGVPYFAVSVALLRQGGTELGLVYDPERDECFAARRGHGAWLDGRPLRLPPAAPRLAESVAMIDFKRLDAALATRLAVSPPFASLRSFGAGALDWCWLAAGRCSVYLHGGHRLWDRAAGSLILNEAGGRALTLDGLPPDVPALEPRSVVAAGSEALLAEWRAWLAAGASQGKPL